LRAGFAAGRAALPAVLSCVDGDWGEFSTPAGFAAARVPADWCVDDPQAASVIPAAAMTTTVATGRLNILTSFFPAISLDGRQSS
jgi:hypothetical protein